MEKGYKILGNYIRLVDERNRNLAITKLLGVSINKKFIPSIANIVGTDLSNYKIVRTGQFAYGPVTSCLLYTSPSPRDKRQSRMPSSA